jgi:hypothetical protein
MFDDGLISGIGTLNTPNDLIIALHSEAPVLVLFAESK